MTFEVVATAGDVPVDTIRKVVVDSRAIALVHTADDEFYAVDDRCSHADVSLSEGYVDGCMIECWLHGSEFDLRTGVPTNPPAFEPIPTYAVRVTGTGDAAVIEVDPTPVLAQTTTSA
jgi:3-phenylpropionate/trans-cinnamate dioxygenase ferredoxin component